MPQGGPGALARERRVFFYVSGFLLNVAGHGPALGSIERKTRRMFVRKDADAIPKI